MSAEKSVVIGYSPLSPLGPDLAAQWDTAARGKSGVDVLTRFPLKDNFPVRIAGQVDEIDVSMYPALSPRSLAHWTSPIFKNAMLVVLRALENSGIEIDNTLSSRVAVTFSSAVGGLDAVLKADRNMISHDKMPHPFTNPNSCINMVGGKISILTNATGPIVSTVTACATGCTSMTVGDMMLRLGMADVVICGAVDFCLVEPIVSGFAAMNGAYKHKDTCADEPGQASRPFSVDRRGFIVSEGAGCIMLATKDFAHAHGLDYTMEIAGWCMNSDASHFVAPNFDTVKRCIEESIDMAGITPGDIDSINAHGTSTRVGDKIEADAIVSVFKKNIPPVTANKSLTGHAMGASSALESIYAMEGMRRDTVLPTINYKEDPEIILDSIVTEAQNCSQEFVLKNSFGFGGCNTCIVFRRIN